jgi:hypothetical protein
MFELFERRGGQWWCCGICHAGLLLTQLGPGDPRLVKVPRASPEMVQILRDEHRLIANMVELQIASEKMRAYGGGEQVTKS